MSHIARSWTGRVPAERGDEYLAYLRRTGVAELRATPGNRSVQVLRRAAGDVCEFLLISTWESEDAIRAFAGEPIDRARYYPEDAGFLLELTDKVVHWELADEQPPPSNGMPV